MKSSFLSFPLLLFILLLSPATIEFENFEAVQIGNQVTLSWDSLPANVQSISVYHGAKQIAVLPPDQTDFIFTQLATGISRLSVAALEDGAVIGEASAIVYFGRLLWDPPPGGWSGLRYRVRASVNENDVQPPFTLPGYDIELEECTLAALYSEGMLAPNESYFATVTCYVIDPVVGEIESGPSDVVTFDYVADIAPPSYPPAPPLNFRVSF
jgi:hypothetical protein